MQQLSITLSLMSTLDGVGQGVGCEVVDWDRVVQAACVGATDLLSHKYFNQLPCCLCSVVLFVCASGDLRTQR